MNEKWKNFFKKLGKGIWALLNSKIFYIVLIGLLVVFGLKTCNNTSDLKIENKILAQNVLAARDSVHTFMTANGELQGEKAIYIKTEKELKAENSDLYRRIKDQDGNVISLNRTIVRLRQDKKMLNDSINTLNKIIGDAVKIDENTWMLPWELDYKWDETNYDCFKGQTFVSVDMNPDGTYKLKPDGTLNVKHDNTLMYYRETQIDIEFGEKVVDDKYHVYIKSAYPGFTPESMEGVFIDPNTNKDIIDLMKKKHWFTGFSLGISVTPGYDIIGQKAAVVVGPSLSWNIYTW